MLIVENSKGVINYNRPIIVGCLILSLSKVYLWSFWYKVLKPTFGLGTFICNTDTDSYQFSVECPSYEHYLEKLKSIAHHLDLSNLDPSHPLYSVENRKVLGKLKLETGGRKIKAICCLKSKCYSILLEDASNINKLKGVQKAFVKNKMTFDHYRDCVLNSTVRFATFKRIVCKQHDLYTVQQTKCSLRNSDGKRQILSDGVSSLAYGHFLLR